MASQADRLGSLVDSSVMINSSSAYTSAIKTDRGAPRHASNSRRNQKARRMLNPIQSNLDTYQNKYHNQVFFSEKDLDVNQITAMNKKNAKRKGLLSLQGLL
tara:strand:+ start:95 stop:400 length:306 start_codon:yes stop_codon:yes gene_type:complete